MTYLDDFGPFFGVDTHSAHESAHLPWITINDLLVDGGHLLRRRVARVRAALAGGGGADVEQRVAASVAHLGLVARIIAPAMAAETVGHGPISLAPGDLWWRDELGGPYPLSVTTAHGADTDADTDAITLLTASIRDLFGVSEHTLGGNVASAINSAARLIASHRPEFGAAAHNVADRLLADPRIEGGSRRAGPQFRRRSCCLIYQVTGDRTAVCGDCVLTASGPQHTG